MTKVPRYQRVALAAGAFLASVSFAAADTGASAAPALYGRVPLHFERNDGQADPRVRFIARGLGYGLFLSPGEVVIALEQGGRGPHSTQGAPRRSGVARLKLVGADARAEITGGGPLPGRSHYLLGEDPRAWRTDVPHFERVGYRGVYPGVDLVFYGSQGTLEYDFVVAQGADPRAIRMEVGADAVRLDDAGRMILETAAGEIVQEAPVAYQTIGGRRQPVGARYVLDGRIARFEVASYDRRLPLVIDPVLRYSSYLGGSLSDVGWNIAVDRARNVYVAGRTASTNLPTVGALQAANRGGEDAFVTKISPTGTLVYSTYLGGNGADAAFDIAVDLAGNAYVAGETSSTNFPTTAALQGARAGLFDAFVSKINAAGSALVYSTYLGGAADDRVQGIAVDGAGSVYVAGYTLSTNFPTANAIQAASGGGFDAFAARLNAAGSALLYSTYIGGSGLDFGHDAALDAGGQLHVAGYTTSTDFPTAGAIQAANAGGSDAFVAKLDTAGAAFVYSTYLGGSADDVAWGVATDPTGAGYVVGQTSSANFPTAAAYQGTRGGLIDAFAAKLTAAGDALRFSTYLGGLSNDSAYAVTARSGNAQVAGVTESSNFPVARPMQATRSGRSDVFLTRFEATGNNVVYSTYLGGPDWDDAYGVAEDGLSTVYVTGETTSTAFPTATPFQAAHAGVDDAFVSRVDPWLGPATLAADTVASAASDGNGVFEPGETANLVPGWRNNLAGAQTFAGALAGFQGPLGGAYIINDPAAAYGAVAASATGNCLATGDCYGLTVTGARPAQHWDATAFEKISPQAEEKTWTIHLGDSFADVPRSHLFYSFIETLLHGRVTAGCTPTDYCPASSTTRGQMAVFLLRSKETADYVPPPATGVFSDVPASHPFAAHIEELARRAITSGCGTTPPAYCPDAAVLRSQMAVFLLRTQFGGSYAPPPATGIFADVPAGDFFAPFIEDVYNRGITTGCGTSPLRYCPGDPVTRAQMAVFLARTFGLLLYAP